MIQTLIGRKIDQTQGFLEDGTRVPLSIISVGGNVVTQLKTTDHEGYNSVQLGFGSTKRLSKPMTGHINKAGLKENKPRFFREVRVDALPDQIVGSELKVIEMLEPGDVVDVMGISKGKGYAGVVKLHGFRGGPKTHGQSDRHRAPGAIGSGTTPGRVYKGKKMSGKMGNDQVTIKNLEVLEVQEDTILVRGLIPGVKGSIVTVTKVGKNKKFRPLWSEPKEEQEQVDEVVEVAPEPAETVVEAPQEEARAEEEVVTSSGADSNTDEPEATVASQNETESDSDEGKSREAGSGSAGEVKEDASK